MSNAVTKFEIGTLDLSGFEGTNNSDNANQKAQYLKKPGVYKLNITEVKLYEGRQDGAGKQWGSALVKTADQENGRLYNFFIDIPVETLMYTSASGSQSKVKTQIFTNLLGSILGRNIATKELPSLIGNLHEILKPGASLIATLDYTKPYIKGHYNEETKTSSFTVRYPDGSDLVDPISGEVISCATFNEAAEIGQQSLGYKVSTGMQVRSFLKSMPKGE